MAFSFGSFMDGVTAAASHLVALAAGAAEKIHEYRADHPLVAQALALAEKDFPGLLVVEGVAQTVLALAQTAVNSLQASVIAAGPVVPVSTSPATTTQTAPTPAPAAQGGAVTP